MQQKIYHFDNICATNSCNTNYYRHALEVAEMTMDGCFMGTLKSDALKAATLSDVGK